MQEGMLWSRQHWRQQRQQDSSSSSSSSSRAVLLAYARAGGQRTIQHAQELAGRQEEREGLCRHRPRTQRWVLAGRRRRKLISHVWWHHSGAQLGKGLGDLRVQ